MVSGPLWTGPLHDAAYLMDMLNLAKQWGWIGCDGKDSLEKLITVMVDESDPKLPFGYIKLDEVLLIEIISLLRCEIMLSTLVRRMTCCGFCIFMQMASRAKINSPPLKALMSAMHQVYIWKIFVRNKFSLDLVQYC